MDFELKTLTLAGAAAEKCDALILLVGESFKPGKDVLSRLAGDAVKARDFEPKAGKLLHSYRSAGIAATRLVLAGVGDGTPKRVQTGKRGGDSVTSVPTGVLAWTRRPLPGSRVRIQ